MPDGYTLEPAMGDPFEAGSASLSDVFAARQAQKSAFQQQQGVADAARAQIGDKLASTWPARLAQSAWSGMTLPGDVYHGKVDMGSDEGVGRALDLAGLMIGAPAGASIPRGAGEVLGSGAIRPAAIADAVAPGVADRISTRVPYNKVGGVQNEAGHQSADLIVGHDSSREAANAYAKNAELIKSYPGLRLGKASTPEEVSEAFINHSKDNLLALYDAIPAEIREQSKLWYDGANKLANEWAEEFGLHPRQTAGVLAALSPQKDWFQNVSLGRRLLDIHNGQAATAITPEMNQYASKYIGALRAEGKNAVADGLERRMQSFQGQPLGSIADPYDRAVWSRWFDEAHNPRDYPVVTPQGGYGSTAVTKGGEPQKVAWGSFDQIANATGAIANGDPVNISKLMGTNHKVRNFYNNIISPNAPHGDVTIDTHAIAADQMRPLAGGHPEVEHGLGLSGAADAATGSKGMYGLHAEAYRRAAAERGVLPREMQSVTWEGIRGLFSPEQKRDKNLAAAIHNIWQGYQSGGYDLAQAHRAISEAAGGINPPEWFQPRFAGHAGGGNSSNARELFGYGLGTKGASPAGMDRGARGRSSRGFSEDVENARLPGKAYFALPLAGGGAGAYSLLPTQGDPFEKDDSKEFKKHSSLGSDEERSPRLQFPGLDVEPQLPNPADRMAPGGTAYPPPKPWKIRSVG